MNLEDFSLIPHTCKTVKPSDRFGRLTVLATGKPSGSYRYKAVCQCDCGSAPFTLRLDALTSGAQVSCGCFHRENHFKHGLSKHPLYQVWRHMMQRCQDSSVSSFKDYGGRGIEVCARWQQVENFVSDMQDPYSPGLEIERINNDGNYEPTNCRWATNSEQGNNRRSTRKITYNGKTQSVRQWAKELGISYGTLWERLAIWHWPPERAFTTPALTAKDRMQIARDARWNR